MLSDVSPLTAFQSPRVFAAYMGRIGLQKSTVMVPPMRRMQSSARCVRTSEGIISMHKVMIQPKFTNTPRESRSEWVHSKIQ